MTINKIMIYASIIICIFSISIPTITKVINKNHNALYKVTEKKIGEAALKCIYDGVCKNSKVTLAELYANNYLTDKIANPVTKLVYNDSSYVEVTKKETKFYPVD